MKEKMLKLLEVEKNKLKHNLIEKLNKENKNIGLEEVIEGDGVCVIEWPMYIEEFIPSSYLKVNITLNNNNSRTIEIESFGKKYDEVICKLKEII